MATRLTMLNSMAGEDFAAALDRHVAWGIRDLDLRDGIYGHWLKTLPVADAKHLLTTKFAALLEK